MNKILYIVFLIMAVACGKQQPFTIEEKEIIGSLDDGLMKVLTIANQEDSFFLRKETKGFKGQELESELLSILKQRMLLTVNDTTNPGVGIAAPQVGINRMLIAVQRFDREGEPFEFYINPQILNYSSRQVLGREGCLSIPDRMDSVWRAKEIVIRYVDSVKQDSLIWKEETIKGFTAVIFQHEIDHLHGILYLDRVENKNE